MPKYQDQRPENNLQRWGRQLTQAGENTSKFGGAIIMLVISILIAIALVPIGLRLLGI